MTKLQHLTIIKEKSTKTCLSATVSSICPTIPSAYATISLAYAQYASQNSAAAKLSAILSTKLLFSMLYWLHCATKIMNSETTPLKLTW